VSGWALAFRRVLGAAATIVALSAILFACSEILPGDAATAALGSSATPEQVARYRADHDLDGSPFERYLEWIGGALEGDLGTSTATNRQVTDMLGAPMRDSLLLAAIAGLATIVLALVFGVAAGLRPGSRRDVALSSGAVVLVAIPQFVLAVMLIALFASFLHVLPAVSIAPAGGTPLDDPQILVLPALSLVLFGAAWATRLVRAAVVEANAAPDVEAARLAGLPERRVIVHHLLPGALGPCVQTFAWLTAFMLGGAAVVEQAFNYPGVSRLLVEAVRNHDTAVLEAIGLLFAVVVTIAFTVADLLVVACNPKLRTAR
jgi:peptide/nickel transport system permease protein